MLGKSLGLSKTLVACSCLEGTTDTKMIKQTEEVHTDPRVLEGQHQCCPPMTQLAQLSMAVQALQQNNLEEVHHEGRFRPAPLQGSVRLNPPVELEPSFEKEDNLSQEV